MTRGRLSGAPLALAERPAPYLANGGPGQFVDEPDLAGELVRGHVLPEEVPFLGPALAATVLVVTTIAGLPSVVPNMS